MKSRCLQSTSVSIAVRCYKTPVFVSVRFYKNARIRIRTFLQKRPYSYPYVFTKTPVFVSVRFYKNARIRIRTFLQKRPYSYPYVFTKTPVFVSVFEPYVDP